MNRNFKKVAKRLGLEGWSFLLDENGRMYLSKFNPIEKRNNDEYRIYFFVNDDRIQIVRKIVLVSSKYKKNMSSKNRFYQEGILLLDCYFKSYKTIHGEAS